MEVICLGLFKVNKDLYTCKVCNQDFYEENYNLEFGVCNSCLLKSGVHIDQMTSTIPFLQEKANSTSNPTEKISYLTSMLEVLYKYKILYADNDVHLINQDIEELIDEVIDCIADAKI